MRFYLLLGTIVGCGLIISAAMTRFAWSQHDSISAQYQLIWDVQSIDTMKQSRDGARKPELLEEVPEWVNIVSKMEPTHVAVATPYDEEFIPVLETWVDEIRAHEKNVWFRGNFAGWEEWFEYERLESVDDHHRLQWEFITNNPDLFKPGDIFTPAIEPENGMLGDPRYQNRDVFLQFLVDSYDTCVAAMQEIGAEGVKCGYFSTNGDVLREVFTPEIVAQTGGVAVPDHYVGSVERFEEDLEAFYALHQAPLALGEFGAPIPDLQGDLSQEDQAAFVDGLLDVLYRKRDKVTAVNYWVFLGGSTRLYDSETEPRQVVEVLKNYYEPGNVSGVVTNTAGDRIEGAEISINDGSIDVFTDEAGVFVVPIPAGKKVNITIRAEGYAPIFLTDIVLARKEIKMVDEQMEPLSESTWYSIRKRLFELHSKVWTIN